MVGFVVGADTDSAGPTAATATAVTASGPKPSFVPVTLTPISASRSSAVSTYSTPIAPAMSMPSRSHCTVNAASFGVHFPGSTVSVASTLSLPDTVGVGATNLPIRTFAVGVAVVDTAVKPAFEPVTFTPIFAPRSSTFRTYDDFVAPAMGTPSRVQE